jgi:hypothetical protein
MKLNKLTLWDAAFALTVIAFVVFKIPHLYLPYYWDESWSYAPALQKMAERSISLMPGAIPADNYRGHPTLFYAMAGTWMKIFGISRFSLHSFAMAFSVVGLTTVYAFGRRFFTPIVGLSAVLLLIPQGYFLTQSSMALPEVAVMFWTLLAFYFYFQNKWWAYVFAGSALVMTKESGLVLIATLLLGWLIECLIKIKSITLKEWFVNSCRIAAPLIPFAAFFCLQKLILGWFLFPEHVDYMVFDYDKIVKMCMPIVFDTIFWYDKRHIVRALFLIGSIFLIGTAIWKRNASELKDVLFSRIIGYFLLFFFVFICFSAFNVFTVRYILCCLPLLTLLSAYLFYEGLFKNKWITMVVVLGISTYLFQWTIKQPDTNDISWGMYDMIKVHDLGVQWFEKNAPFNSRIGAANFLVVQHLTDAKTGGLSSKNTYPNTSWYITNETDFVVVTHDCFDNRIEPLKKEGKLELVEHFESGKAWYEIYKVKK